MTSSFYEYIYGKYGDSYAELRETSDSFLPYKKPFCFQLFADKYWYFCDVVWLIPINGG